MAAEIYVATAYNVNAEDSLVLDTSLAPFYFTEVEDGDLTGGELRTKWTKDKQQLIKLANEHWGINNWYELNAHNITDINCSDVYSVNTRY